MNCERSLEAMAGASEGRHGNLILPTAVSAVDPGDWSIRPTLDLGLLPIERKRCCAHPLAA